MIINTKNLLMILDFVENGKCPKHVIPQFENENCSSEKTCTECWINSLEKLKKHVDLDI